MELKHYGIQGQKWYIRRFQNEDGSLTNAGKRRYYKSNGEFRRSAYNKRSKDIQKQLDQETEYVKKNLSKINKEAYNTGDNAKMLKEFESELKSVMRKRNVDGSLNANYANAYNRKAAEIFNSTVKDMTLPSGRVVQWVASRGSKSIDIKNGVAVVLASPDVDVSKTYKSGVYAKTGKVAYRNENLEVK